MPTTQAAIRDRAKALIEALTPSALVGDRFRSSRNEGKGDFLDWAENNVAAALRRFQARTTGNVPALEQSGAAGDERHVEVSITIAYPHTARYGADQAMDRDDVMDEDFTSINYAIGVTALANFTATGAVPYGATKTIVRGTACDFLIVTQRFKYTRAL